MHLCWEPKESCAFQMPPHIAGVSKLNVQKSELLNVQSGAGKEWKKVGNLAENTSAILPSEPK